MSPTSCFLVLAVLAVGGVWVSRRLLGSMMTPVAVYFAVWIPLGLLTLTSAGGIQKLGERTWVAVTVAAASFTAGAVYAGILVAGARSVAAARPRSKHATAQQYDVERLLRWFRIGTIALAGWVVLEVVTLLPVVREAGGFHALFSNGIAVRRALYSAGVSAAGTDFNGGSLTRSLVGYVLFLGSLTLFWSPVVARTGRWRLALSPLLIMAVFSFVTLQRFAFVYSLSLASFAAVYHRRSSPNTRLWTPSARNTALLALVLVPIMVYAPLKLRQPNLTPAGATKSVLSYYTGGVGALDNQVRQYGLAPRDGKWGHGRWTFWGEATIASRLGAHTSLPPKDLPYVDVGRSTPVIANVYTYLVYFLNDFGFLGLIFCPFLLAFAATAITARVRESSATALIPAASILMTTVAMSFFGLSLIRDTRYLVIALAAPFAERLVRGSASEASLTSVGGGVRA